MSIPTPMKITGHNEKGLIIERNEQDPLTLPYHLAIEQLPTSTKLQTLLKEYTTQLPEEQKNELYQQIPQLHKQQNPTNYLKTKTTQTIQQKITQPIKKHPITTTLATLTIITSTILPLTTNKPTHTQPTLEQQITTHLKVIEEAQQRNALNLHTIAPIINHYQKQPINPNQLNTQTQQKYQQLEQILQPYQKEYNEAMGR